MKYIKITMQRVEPIDRSKLLNALNANSVAYAIEKHYVRSGYVLEVLVAHSKTNKLLLDGLSDITNFAIESVWVDDEELHAMELYNTVWNHEPRKLNPPIDRTVRLVGRYNLRYIR